MTFRDSPTTDRVARDRPTALAALVRRAAPPLMLLLSVAGAAATLQLSPSLFQAAPPAVSPAQRIETLPARTDALWPVIDEWGRLRRSAALPFGDYARFLEVHPGWPGELNLRRAAEKALQPDATSPTDVVAYFDRQPPLTANGRVRYAEALDQLGRKDDARTAALAAWTGGAVTPTDETRLLARFGTQFTPADQDKRMERLLWDGAAASAQRQLVATSAARRPLYAVRLALLQRSADAASQVAALEGTANRDPGYVLGKADWLKATGQAASARAWLAQTRTLDGAPYDPARWLASLLDYARDADAQGDVTGLIAIARLGEQTYPDGTVVRDHPLNERDPYTSLMWLAGQAAMKSGRATDAVRLFGRYADAAQTPGSQAKGWYWAGRAASGADADGWYARAAANDDQYYGQLAAERLGRLPRLTPEPPAIAIPDDRRLAFRQSEVVRAAVLLGQQRRYSDQSLFVRQIAQGATSDMDHALVDQLSDEIRRPDLGVIASRTARASGARDPVRYAFPTVPVPPAFASHWTMIHAITRQESQFDREALSPVGARGLMQLMPRTAAEQAGKLGLPWTGPERLSSDGAYNVEIGSSFFDRMMTYYSGSYVLAVAAYNAGPGNVNKFIRKNGDPRLPGTDVVAWVEAIPLSETRGYVQHVLENAVVYDLLNPARPPMKNRLSHYLGKTGAG